MSTCTCPKRANEQGAVVPCGLDVCCPTHGDPLHFKATDRAMQEARAAIIQTPGVPQGANKPEPK